MNTTTTKPAIIQLDDASRSPSKTLSEYCKNCSNAVTNALNEFPVVQKTANCKISHGFVKENALISMLWTTTFENPPNKKTNHGVLETNSPRHKHIGQRSQDSYLRSRERREVRLEPF